MKNPGSVKDQIIEQAWLILINFSGKGALHIIIQDGKLLDLIYKKSVHDGSLFLHENTWRIMQTTFTKPPSTARSNAKDDLSHRYLDFLQ